MPERHALGPRAAALTVALLSTALVAPVAGQQLMRLPDVDVLARQGENVAPGANSPMGSPPVYSAPSPSAMPGALDEPTALGGPVPLGQPPGPPPSQGQTALAYGPSSELPWSWHWLPTGLMYRSYLAGVKEPRLGTAWLTDRSLGPYHDTRLNTDDPGTVWDSTLGARVGILRYGTPNAYRPEGFQVDLTGSAQPRLNPYGASSPLLSCDYTIGIPVTYARGKWQYKTGYNHLSSHFGDEFLINNPQFLALRRNYVRDAVMLGVGCYVTDNLRMFGEFDYAMGAEDGAQPVELQWGIDYSPAKAGGAPFFAVYADQRQELKYGGFFVVQAGWQWRGGLALSTFRIGLEYFNGKSPQFETFNQFEQRIGWGIWYDF
jgi:Protein of unknown function (DUF1207)